MASDKDKLFEKIYFLWKGEGEKRNQSIDWYCERYGAKIEEWRKWYQGINKSVKEIQVIGRPGQQQDPEPQTPESAEDAMSRLRERQESEARIVITTSDAGKKQKPAIASLTINLGNGLHMTRKGMSIDEFLTFAQNLKALC